MIRAPGAAGALRTHCRRGHELVGDNVKLRPGDGGKVCRACERLRSAVRRGDFAARTAIANENTERRRQSLSRDRANHLRRKYGLSLDRFEELLEAQDGACAACGLELVLDQVNADAAACVDQCASSGVVRGVVCRRCSNVLARLGGDVVLAAKVAKYLCAAIVPATAATTRSICAHPRAAITITTET